MKNICQSIPRHSLLLLLIFNFQFAFSQTVKDYGFQVGYGYSVGATILKGDTMFVGGDFDYIGPYTGSLVEADLSSGAIRTSWPLVNGTIRTMISDGSGGWFIGGDFTLIGGVARKGFAHLTSAKKLDLSWNLNVNEGARVNALLLSPSKDILWVAGNFTSFGNAPNNMVAAVNISTKSVINGWGPGNVIGANWWPGSGSVEALAYYSASFGLVGDVPRLFIGGDFRNASWQEVNLASLDPVTGKMLSSSKTATNHYGGTPVSPMVRSLLVYDRYLYIGGLFSSITDNTGTTYTRQSLAKMNVYTGKLDAFFDSDIYPKSESGRVNCMKIVNIPNSTLGNVAIAIGGLFDKVQGDIVSSFALIHPSLASSIRYDNSIAGPDPRGNVLDTTVNPGVYQTAEIFCFDTMGTVVYLAGNFEAIKELSTSTIKIRRNLAAVDLKSNSLKVSNWAPAMQTDRPVRAINISGTDVIVGGSFTSAGGIYRKNLAAVDLKTKTVLPLSLKINSYINAFELSETKDTLYIGGNFTNIGTIQRGYIAAVDLRNNALLPWASTTAAGGGVESLVLDKKNKILYAGGKFKTMGGKTRNNLAALSSVYGNVIKNWTADVDNIGPTVTPVRSLAYANDILYVGGRFNTIGGQSRSNIAAVNTKISSAPADTTASVTNWDFPVTPASDRPDIAVNVLSLYNGRLYIGGKFDAINNNTSIKNLAAIQLSTTPNTLDESWTPTIRDGGGGVNCITPDHDILYIGGDFGTINGVATSSAGAINLQDGSIASAWQPYPTKQPFGGTIETICPYNGIVYCGGSQEAMTEDDHDAVFHLATYNGIEHNPLPLVWDYFNGLHTSEGNLLQWHTLSEGIAAEIHRSADGISFTTLGQVPASGFATFLDKNVEPGQTYYYRLKLMQNQSHKFTGVIRISGNKKFTAFPVFSPGGMIKIIAPTGGIQWTLFTTQGQCVDKRRLNEGANFVAVNHLAHGIYFYSMQKEDTWISGKIKL